MVDLSEPIDKFISDQGITGRSAEFADKMKQQKPREKRTIELPPFSQLRMEMSTKERLRLMRETPPSQQSTDSEDEFQTWPKEEEAKPMTQLEAQRKENNGSGNACSTVQKIKEIEEELGLQSQTSDEDSLLMEAWNHGDQQPIKNLKNLTDTNSKLEEFLLPSQDKNCTIKPDTDEPTNNSGSDPNQSSNVVPDTSSKKVVGEQQ